MSILIFGEQIRTSMFLLIEKDALVDSIFAKMLENGNKVYNNITELQEAMGIR